MKRILLAVTGFVAMSVIAQTEIEPFAPTVPGTYIGDIPYATSTNIGETSPWSEEGDTTPNDHIADDDFVTPWASDGGVGAHILSGAHPGETVTLISPELDFGTATGSPTLEMRWRQSTFGGFWEPGQIEVMYKESAAGAWTVLQTYTLLDDVWHDEVIDLSGAASYATYYLGWRFSVATTTGSFYDYSLSGVDEIVVYGTGSPCTPTASAFPITACDSYTVPSGDETHTTTGVYNDTIPNVGGCDSVMTITLTVDVESTSAFPASGCADYTVPSGDETYTVDGVVMDTIPNAAGCDSVMTITVTIGSPDLAVSVAGATLTAAASGVTYQWIDCATMTPIVGATNQEYTATQNGSYAVIITDGACIDTSACTAVTEVSIGEDDLGSVLIYPNPTEGNVTVQLDGFKQIHGIELYSSDGKLIMASSEVHLDKYEFDIRDLETGFYTVRVLSEDGPINKILVKK